MSNQNFIEILHVCRWQIDDRDRNVFDTHKVELLEVGNKDDPAHIDESSCNEIEKHLRLLPDPKALEKFEPRSFKWKDRTLVKVYGLAADKDDRAERVDYLMYVCLDEDSNLGENEFLNSLNPYAPKVYGGAWILKKEAKTGESNTDKAVYLQNREDDLDDEKEIVFLKDILKTTMVHLQHWTFVNTTVQSGPR